MNKFLSFDNLNTELPVEVISKARVVPLSDGDDTDFEEDSFGRKRVKGGKWVRFSPWRHPLSN